MTSEPLLSVRELEKHYPITEGVLKREVGSVRAVDGISFDLHRGETLGLVGESGCGKSTAATTLLRLENSTGGTITFDGKDISEYDSDELTRFRREAQMVFQDPNSSFDPRMTIGESVAEPLRVHGLPKERRRAVVKNILHRIGLERTDIDRYPHEFSGGQKQRIALARALVTNPELVVADEPVSALDVSVQAEILALIQRIQAEFDLSILLISHDLDVVRQVCDRVAVMYLGEIVEVAPTEELFADPQHPYTRALLGSIPTADPRKRGEGAALRGDVPSPANPPSGCRFHSRCPEIIQPEEYEFEQEHWRGVMNLRHHLGGESTVLESAEELHAERTGDEAASSTTDELTTLIREQFGLPDALQDSDADRVLSDALESIAEGDVESASTLLADEFATVCERAHPDLLETDAGHPASCHLYASSDEPREGGRTVSADSDSFHS